MPLTATPAMVALRFALARQEKHAGDGLESARRLRVPRQEEAVTSDLLLGLALDVRANSRIRARAYTKPQEGRVGADWLWAFRGRTGRVAALLVQAKLLSREAPLTYAVNQWAAGGEQPDRHHPSVTQRQVLLRTADRFGLPAAYVLYNDSDRAPGLHRPCRWEWLMGPLGGVALVGAHELDQVLGAVGTHGVHVNADFIGGFARPLSCALLCTQHDRVERRDSPIDEAVRVGLRRAGIVSAVHPSESHSGESLRQMLDELFDITSRATESNNIGGLVADVLGTTASDGVLLVDEGSDQDE